MGAYAPHGTKGQLPATWDAFDDNVVVRDASGKQRVDGRADQRVDHGGVPACMHNTYSKRIRARERRGRRRRLAVLPKVERRHDAATGVSSGSGSGSSGGAACEGATCAHKWSLRDVDAKVAAVG